MTAVTVMPSATANPMSSRRSVRCVEKVRRTRPGIAANASARHAAARRPTKPARTAKEPPSFPSPNAIAGRVTTAGRGSGADGAAAFAFASISRACSAFAGLAGLGFFAGLGGFLGMSRGFDSGAGAGGGATLGCSVAGGGGAGAGAAGGCGTGAGSGAG